MAFEVPQQLMEHWPYFEGHLCYGDMASPLVPTLNGRHVLVRILCTESANLLCAALTPETQVHSLREFASE